jgi:hypothetical protein
MMRDVSNVRVSGRRILIGFPLILSILASVYLLLSFHNINENNSRTVSSLQGFVEPHRRKVDYSLLDETAIHKRSCVITVAAWKYYAHVRTLHDSIQLNSPIIRCFVWFVADSTYHSDDDGSSEKVAMIKDRVAGHLDLVTVDQLSTKISNMDLFTMQSFSSHLTEEQCTAFLTPLALQYTIQNYDIDSVIYLDKYLWVDNSLEYVQMKLNTQSITIGPSPSSPKDALGVLALSRNALPAVKYLASWSDHVCKYGTQPFHVIGAFEEEDWEVLYDEQSRMTVWNFHTSQHKESLQSSKTSTSSLVLFINFHSSAKEAQVHRSRLEAYNASYFEQIPYGFNYFSDGTLIEPWMAALLESMMTPVEERDDGTIIPRFYRDNIYTRLYFQDRVYSNPFLVELPKAQDLEDKITFMDWLLRGPSSYAVDMEGKFYFSEIEDNTWNSLNYYPMGSVGDPHGTDFHMYKIWFETQAGENGRISKKLHEKVMSQYKFHYANHDLYHKSASSPSQIGVNVIGW